MPQKNDADGDKSCGEVFEVDTKPLPMAVEDTPRIYIHLVGHRVAVSPLTMPYEAFLIGKHISNKYLRAIGCAGCNKSAAAREASHINLTSGAGR